ncbi:MAG: MarR family transcriptional regulator [Spirochaetales bacterium]|nr:MarR family transcriptional regulator [Spirochaetales bacterium]NLX44331.1 MarR family transcriptional regulator [Treponema sp.]HOI22740.1 MarR family transcriptional regulator [Spirochaetales bacterium]
MEEYLMMGLAYGLWRRKASAALEPFGITFQQYQLVRQARRKGALILSAAAGELGMDKPTLSLVARKCVEAGWLTRTDSMTDRRASRLSLSGLGEELLDKIEALRLFSPESLGDALDVLGSEERSELKRMMDRVSRRARDVFV